MDVMQRLEDLMNLALDERTSENERINASLGALRLIREYKLLGKKHVDVAANIIDKVTNPEFVEDMASRAEKIASAADRIFGSVKKFSDRMTREPRSPSSGERGSGRRRQYRGR
jgi:hypothetical protein